MIRWIAFTTALLVGLAGCTGSDDESQVSPGSDGSESPSDSIEWSEEDTLSGPWLAARESGVDFRALGNEPGWILDIYEGERFDLRYRYGERTAVLPFTSPQRMHRQHVGTPLRSRRADSHQRIVLPGMRPPPLTAPLRVRWRS